MTKLTLHSPRVAMLGVGHVGTALARVMLDAGLDVRVAASGDPAKIALIASVLMPGAVPGWAQDAVADADIVVLAIPLHRFPSLDHGMLNGKIVIDTMNYWAPSDGVQSMFENTPLGSSEVVQRTLAGARVVKTFNHIGYHEMAEQRHVAGSPERRALGVASDDAEAAALVGTLVDAIGYDVVTLGSLHGGVVFEPGGPVFGARLTAEQFERAAAVDAAA
jgi:predicted dinucleotide-binding enzyme